MMRRLLLAASAAALAAACARPGGPNNDGVFRPEETISSICAAIQDLAIDMDNSGDVMSDRWVSDIDAIGIRAVGIDTNTGHMLSGAIARWSVGQSEGDFDFAAEALEDIDGICN
jgi:type IV pilus biogenesis protein CpaD/CtpE